MKYSGIIENDFTAAPGVSVSFFTQGCPHRCVGCHNPETWDFNGGKDFTSEVLDNIIAALTANGLKRNLCIMGGEPLCEQNISLTHLVISNVKEKIQDVKVYIWTGYIYENLLKNASSELQKILAETDVLIDGPYIESLRDITLPMRGSSNQRIIELKK
jgi:anaerobic ribonucleoside-triphosphate reductase activating protein